MNPERLQQLTQLLYFLYYLKEEEGSDFMMGGWLLGDVYEGTLKFLNIDRESFEEAVNS